MKRLILALVLIIPCLAAGRWWCHAHNLNGNYFKGDDASPAFYCVTWYGAGTNADAGRLHLYFLQAHPPFAWASHYDFNR